MMNNEIFFDYAYNDSNAYHSLENDLHLKGASLTFPLEAKDLGCGIDALIKQCKFLLFPTDNGKIDCSHLKIAKDNNIPYCIVACSNYAKVTTCLPKEEHDYIFNYEHSEHRMKLYELLHSHGCLELVNDNSVNYIMTKPTDECFKYGLYMSYNRKDFEGCYKELGLSSTSEIKNEPDETKEAGNGTVIIDDNSTSILHKENQTEEEENYNVFISCKSEDYDFAQPIHDFLIANGLKVFFADAELKEKAESQYADVIDEALDATKHLIVVATSIGHIKSKWVKYEWSTFSNDLKSNYRDGNLITILSPDITPRMLPASLRHMQSFSIENFENILPYVKK